MKAAEVHKTELQERELSGNKTLEICRVSPLNPQLGTDKYMCSMKKL